MITEVSRKANKLHIMHSAKQIGKIKDNEERERQAKDLEKKAKDAGFTFVSEDIGDDAILLVNQKSHKAAIIGSFKSDGREVLVSYLVNLKKMKKQKNVLNVLKK